MPNIDPYLVVGTGRSGTSFVAGIMHNDMGIHMGAAFPPPDKTNPDGFWEDMDFLRLNTDFMLGKLSYRVFMHKVLGIIKERHKLKKPWGFKESRISSLLGLYFMLFNQPKVIWCKRTPELVIDSLIRCYGYKKETAVKLHKSRMLMLRRQLQFRDPLIIEFNEHRKDKEGVISAIEEKWKKPTKE